MSSGKRWKFKNLITFKGGCGCWPKATNVIQPKASFSDQKRHRPSSTTFSLTVDDGCPENLNHTNHCSRTVSPCPKIQDSLAVVQDSDDPYSDFRQSMLQMIFEREIYAGNDLQQLLHCFLDLNPPHHHDVIVQAFMEIWNGGAAVADGGEEKAPPCSSARGQR